MKKVLIYKPGMRRDPSVGELPNIGMAILAAEFENNGWQARVVDHQMAPKPDVEEGLTILKEYKPDLLCISLVTFEWVLPVTHKIINLANHLKIPVWVGGPHSTAFHDIMAKDDRITKVVNGEVDGQLQEVFKSNEKVVVLPRPKSFTTPNFTLTDDYEKIGLYPLFTSRGCKYKCNFCAATATHGNILRNRTLDDVWKELDSIEEKLPEYILYGSLMMIYNKFDHAMEFVEDLKREVIGKNMNKVINVRADRLHDEFLDWLKRMGSTTFCWDGVCRQRSVQKNWERWKIRHIKKTNFKITILGNNTMVKYDYWFAI